MVCSFTSSKANERRQHIQEVPDLAWGTVQELHSTLARAAGWIWTEALSLPHLRCMLLCSKPFGTSVDCAGCKNGSTERCAA